MSSTLESNIRQTLSAQTWSSIEQSAKAKQKMLEGNHIDILIDMAEAIAESISQGGKLMLCGNGGSAADAQHLAAELLVRLRPHVNRDALAAITLATDISTITACGNDYGYDDIFVRPLAALGRPGDVLLGITTSGKSPNVLKAMKRARTSDIKSFAFLGGGGGPALPLCDKAFIAPSDITARIQECHITAGHVLMELIEEILLAKGQISKTD